MRLKYRGIPYEASILDATAEGTVGLPRPASAPEERSPKASLRQPGPELMYRGVRYTR
ncbi:MAG TPA: DUF4278 domain-containing protein [Candidatus Obscuribacterales bacterium]